MLNLPTYTNAHIFEKNNQTYNVSKDKLHVVSNKIFIFYFLSDLHA